MGHYSVLDNARGIAEELLNKAETAGDLFSPIHLDESFGVGLGEASALVCLQYLAGKELISFSEEKGGYLVMLKADIVDFVG